MLGVDEATVEIISTTQGDFCQNVLARDRSSKLEWEIINVYGPVKDELKLSFLEELSDKIRSTLPARGGPTL